MRHQVSEKIGPWINEAIDTHGLGESILWEPQLMPGQQGEATIVCFFWMPGSVLGSTMQGSFRILDPVRVTKAEVLDIVRDFLTQMRSARTEQVTEQAPSPTERPEEVLRGRQRASGLLIP